MSSSVKSPPEPNRHPVLFVGAGPGDPELITVKGKNALAAADLVIFAGSLVPETLLSWCRENVRVHNSAGMVLEDMVGLMVSGYCSGLKVVRLHTGDPALYGAIFEQMQALQAQSIPFAIIPGVTAAFAAAAAMGIEYTLPDVTQTLILTRMAGRTPVPETEHLEGLAAHKASMAIYLSMGLVDDVAACLSRTYGPQAPCAIAYQVSQPGEKIVFTTVEDLAETATKEQISRQALIIVGSVLNARKDPIPAKSKLYDRQFSHGYRPQTKDSS